MQTPRSRSHTPRPRARRQRYPPRQCSRGFKSWHNRRRNTMAGPLDHTGARPLLATPLAHPRRRVRSVFTIAR
jgi:hypothetical protein